MSVKYETDHTLTNAFRKKLARTMMVDTDVDVLSLENG